MSLHVDLGRFIPEQQVLFGVGLPHRLNKNTEVVMVPAGIVLAKTVPQL